MLVQVQAQHSLDAECAHEQQAPNRTVANSPATQQESMQAPNRAVANSPATQQHSKQVRTCFVLARVLKTNLCLCYASVTGCAIPFENVSTWQYLVTLFIIGYLLRTWTWLHRLHF